MREFWTEIDPDGKTAVCTEIDTGNGPEAVTVAVFSDLLATDGSIEMTSHELATKYAETIQKRA